MLLHDQAVSVSMWYSERSWSRCAWTTLVLTFPNFSVLDLLTMFLQCTRGVIPGASLAEAVGLFAV